ncbi:MAG: HAD family phosphatase [Bacteroidales bacterium]|nr:HAD family phosphatase [Bacteroidales bacterium]
MKNNDIKNIIFDFGGVIINIEPQKVGETLQKMGVSNVEQLHQRLIEEGIYYKIEIGAIKPQDFRDAVKDFADIKLSDEQVDEAWNSLILEIPQARIEVLQQVAKHYWTFLLSNTNEIHYHFYNDYVQQTFKEGELKDFFERAYFSHEMGMRKPSDEIFNVVLKENELNPQETLFIDDSQENLDTASRLGIQTYLLSEERELTEMFNGGRLVI